MLRRILPLPLLLGLLLCIVYACGPGLQSTLNVTNVSPLRSIDEDLPDNTIPTYPVKSYFSQFGQISGTSYSSDSEKSVAVKVGKDGEAVVLLMTKSAFASSPLGGQDIGLVKYDRLGQVVWKIQLGTSVDDVPTHLFLDQTNNNIFLTGYRSTPNSGKDLFVAKYRGNGERIFFTTFSYAGDEMPGGLAKDSEGGLYIAGSTTGSLAESNGGGTSLEDLFLIKLSLKGSLIWKRQLGSVHLAEDQASGSESSISMAIDSDNYIYVGGSTTSSLAEPLSGGKDIFLSKWNSEGELLNLTQLGSTSISGIRSSAGVDLLKDLTVTADGDIYGVGTTTGSLGEANGGQEDIVIVKWNSECEWEWIRQLGSISLPTSNASDNASAVIYDNAKLWITGYTSGSLGETSGGGKDPFLMEMDLDGNIVTLHQLGSHSIKNSQSSGNDESTAIGMDAFHHPVVTGFTDGNLGELNGGEEDFWIWSYVPIIELNSDQLIYSSSQLEGSGAVIVPDILFTGEDEHYMGATLIVDFSSGGSPSTELGISHQGDGNGEIGINGTTISYGGESFAEIISSGENGLPLTITFNSSKATPSAINALLKRIYYSNNEIYSDITSTLTFSFYDDFVTSPLANITLDITSDTIELTIAVNSGLTTPEETTALLSSSHLRATGKSMSLLEYTVHQLPTKGILQKWSGGGWNNLALNGSWTQEDLDNSYLRFIPTANLVGSDSFQFSVKNERNEESDVESFSITITPTNDPPVLNQLAQIEPALATLQSSIHTVDYYLTRSLFEDSIDSSSPSPNRGIAITDTSGGSWEFSLDDGSSWNPLGVVDIQSATLLDKDSLIRHTSGGSSGVTESLTFKGWDLSDGNSGDQLVDVSGGGAGSAYSTQESTHTVNILASTDKMVLANGGASTITSPTANSTQLSAVTLHSGDMVVTYQSNDSSGVGVWGHLVDSYGLAKNSPFALNTTETGSQTFPHVTALRSGGFYTTWLSDDADGTGIWGQKFDSTAVLVGAEQGINSTTTASQNVTQNLFPLDDGGFISSWSTPDSDGAGVVFLRFTPDGEVSGTENVVNQTTTGDQHFGGMVNSLLSDGGFVVTYYDENISEYKVRIYNRDGTARTNEISSPSFNSYSLFMLKGGGFVVTYTGSDAGGKGVYAQRYDKDGVTVGAPFALNSTTAGDQLAPMGVEAIDGSLLFIYYDQNSGMTLARHFDSNGANPGSELSVGATSAYAHTLVRGRDSKIFIYRTNNSDLFSHLLEFQFAPSLTNTNITLTTVTEDNANPSGDTTASMITALGANYVDSNTNPLKGIAITAVDTTHGSWEYSTNNGGIWNSVGVVASNSALLLTNSVNNKIRFIPTSNYEGSSGTMTFKAWDQTTGTNGTKVDTSLSGGSTAFSTQTATASLTVSSVNDVPVIAVNGGLTLLEDATATITSALLSTTDEQTAGFLTYTLTAVPTKGVLQKNGGAWANLIVGGTFTQDDINNSKVRFVTTANLNGADSFEFTVSDTMGGITANTTFNITITPANDDVVLSVNEGLTVNEDSAATLITEDELETTDVDNTNSQITYTLITVPDHGILQKNSAGWNTLSALDTFTQNDIDNDKIRFTPTADENGSDDFTFSVTDGGNSLGPITFTITINPVNDAPVVDTNDLLTPDEDTNTVISNSFLLITDIDNSASQIVFTIGTAPAKGNIEKNTGAWVAIGATETFTQNDIDTGKVRYAPTSNLNGADSFTFTVSDGAGGTIALTTFNITITAVNDDPTVGTNSGLTLNEDATSVIANTILLINDVDNTVAQRTFTLTAIPTKGTLQKDSGGWAGLIVGGTFTQDDINNSRLRFVTTANLNGSDSFEFTVSDGAGGSLAATTFNITINPINDAPTLSTTAYSGFSISINSTFIQSVDYYLSLMAHGDVDGITNRGVAITGITTGTWEYSIDDGDNWNSLAGTSDGNATLLNKNAWIRYSAGSSFGGNDTLSFRAWDISAGSNGAVGVDVSTNGTTTSYSTQTATLTIPVIDNPIQFVTSGSANNLGSITSNLSDDISSATLTNGDLVVAFVNSDVSSTGVYFRILNPDGTAKTADILANTYTHDGQYTPSVAPLLGGGFVIAWQDSNGHVYTQIFDEVGNAVGSEFRLDTTTVGDDQQAPRQVIPIHDGGFIVVFNNFTGNDHIYIQRYSASGEVVGSETQVNVGNSNNYVWVHGGAVLSDGGYVIAWVDSIALKFSFRIFNADGTARSGDIIGADLSSASYFHSLLPTLDGGFYIAYHANDANSVGVYAQKYDREGSPLAVAFPVNTTTAGSQSDLILMNISNSGLMAVFNNAGSLTGRYFNEVGSGGAEFTIGTVSTKFLSITPTKNGNGVVTWNNGGTLYSRLLIPDPAPTLSTINLTLPSTAISTSLIHTVDHYLSQSGFSDSENLTSYGMAVTDVSGGTWEYSLNYGTDWFDLSPADDTNAILLDRSAIIRHTSSSTVGAVESLSYRAWDKKVGTSGDTGVDVTENGGYSAYSSATTTASTTVIDYSGYLSTISAKVQIDTGAPLATLNNHTNPILRTLSSGDLVAVYPKTGTDIYAVILNPDGTVKVPSFIVNTYTTDNQEYPQVATLLGGGFVVVWESNAQLGTGDEIYGQRFDNDGDPLGGEFRVNTYTTDEQRSPSIIALDDGGFLVAWQSWLQDGVMGGVYAQRYYKDGTVSGSEFRVNTTTPMSHTDPTSAALSDGGYAIGLIFNSSTASSYKIYNKDNSLRNEVAFGSALAVTGYSQIIALGDMGYSHLVGLNDGSSSGIAAKLHDRTGTATTGSFFANQTTLNTQQSGFGTLLPDGGIFYIFNNNNTSIRGRYFDKTNVAKSEITLVTGTTTVPSVTTRLDGKLVALWCENGTDIYTQVIEPDPAPALSVGSYSLPVMAASSQTIYSVEHYMMLAGLTDEGETTSLGIAVTGVSGGTWEYSLDNGTNWLDLSGATNLSAILLNKTVLIRHTSSATVGAIETITFLAWDEKTGTSGDAGVDVTTTGGLTPYSSTASTASIEVADYSTSFTNLPDTTTNLGTALDDYLNIVTLKSGDLILVYANPDANGRGIYMMPLNPDGTAKGVATLVNTETNSDQSIPQVTALQNGGFVIYWNSNLQDGSNWGVYGQRYDASFNKAGAEFRVNTTTTFDQYHRAALTGLNDGGFVATWNSNQNGTDFDVYIQSYNASGAIVISEVRANTTTAAGQLNWVRLNKTLSDGGIIIPWITSGTGMRARIFNTDWTLRTSEAVLPTVTTTQTDNSIVVTNNNSFYTFYTVADANGTGAYARKYDRAGAVLAVAFQVNAVTAGNQTAGYGVATPDGGVVFVYQDVGTLKARYYDKNGVAGSELTVGTCNYASASGVTINDEGEVVVAWTDGTNLFTRRLFPSVSPQLATTAITLPSLAVDTVEIHTADYYLQLADGSDNNFDIERGIAVTDVSGGTWEFSTNGGSSWSSLIGVDDTSATLLDKDDLIRHTSSGISGGNETISFRGWDKRGGSAGDMGVDVSDNGGLKPFSAETAVATTAIINYSDSFTNLPDTTSTVSATVSANYYVNLVRMRNNDLVISFTTGDANNNGAYFRSLNADGTTKGAVTALNSTTSDMQGDPQISSTRRGGMVSYWTSFQQDGSSYGIYGRTFDGTYVATSGEILVNTTTASAQNAAQTIISLDSGKFIAAWGDDSSGTTKVNFQKFNSDGSLSGGETLYGTGSAQAVGARNNQTLSDGGYVLTWLDESFVMRANIYDADGTLRTNGVTLTTLPFSNPFNSIIPTLDNKFYLLYTAYDTIGRGVYARKFDHLGNAEGAAFQVNANDAGNQTGVFGVALPNGGVIFCYVDDTTVIVRNYSAMGVAGAETTIGTYGGAAGLGVGITINNAGEVIVGWTDGVSLYTRKIITQ